MIYDTIMSRALSLVTMTFGLLLIIFNVRWKISNIFPRNNFQHMWNIFILYCKILFTTLAGYQCKIVVWECSISLSCICMYACTWIDSCCWFVFKKRINEQDFLLLEVHYYPQESPFIEIICFIIIRSWV